MMMVMTPNIDLYSPTCGSIEKHIYTYIHKYMEKYNKTKKKKEKNFGSTTGTGSMATIVSLIQHSYFPCQFRIYGVIVIIDFLTLYY